jgi:hypothetical protein
MPIGLYRQRSKRVLNLAKEMVKRNGRLPKERNKLEFKEKRKWQQIITQKDMSMRLN